MKYVAKLVVFIQNMSIETGNRLFAVHFQDFFGPEFVKVDEDSFSDYQFTFFEFLWNLMEKEE